MEMHACFVLFCFFVGVFFFWPYFLLIRGLECSCGKISSPVIRNSVEKTQIAQPASLPSRMNTSKFFKGNKSEVCLERRTKLAECTHDPSCFRLCTKETTRRISMD